MAHLYSGEQDDHTVQVADGPSSDTGFTSSDRPSPAAVSALPSHSTFPASDPFDRPTASPVSRPLQSLPALVLETTRNTRSNTVSSTASSPALSAPLKRKPLSKTASPLATRFSSGEHLAAVSKSAPRPEQRFSRSRSVDSPTIYEFPNHSSAAAVVASIAKLPPLDSPSSSTYEEGDTDFEDLQSPVNACAAHGLGAVNTRNIPAGTASDPAGPQTALPNVLSQYEELSSPVDPLPNQDQPLELILADDSEYSDREESNPSYEPNFNSNMSLARKASPPPRLVLDIDDNNDTYHHYSNDTGDPVTATSPASQPSPTPSSQTYNTNKPLPKSPGSKLGALFSWASPSPSATEFSEKGYSPLPSPLSPRPTVFTDDSPVSPRIQEAPTNDQPEANASHESPLDYSENYLHTYADSNSVSAEIDEMEDELKAISAELAASIRREMDLEDLVDRLQSRIDNPQAPGKRTSDYFSDSGISTAKYSEYDQSREEVDAIQRRAEQEKAQIRLELTSKLQDERQKRKDLDQQIKELAEKASQIDLDQTNSVGANDRLKDLETTCEDLRRRLSEEKQVKDNFEDLLSALKAEFQSAANERDNLRDEVVPQLRARVEGLEAQAADNEKLAYETTKMQQQLVSLKEENMTLKRERDLSGPATPVTGTRTSLAKLRSNSVTAAPPGLALPPAASLSRSLSVKSPNTESREALSERLKDVEAQRDALHSALKSLLERQEFQSRENEKKIKALEMERDRLLTSSPRKGNYEKELSNLRVEINVLRRRAEEAIEQKWQVEKGLGGLKMDLDRAEEEIASLRSLLREKDILIPESLSRASSGSQNGVNSTPVTSASLEKAYKDLQTRYTEALDRIKDLENFSGDGDEKATLALQRLKQTLQAATSDRELARTEAESLKSQVESLRAEEESHLASEAALSSQLTAAATRVEDLAAQVSAQLNANAELRQRLSESVARGENAQKADTKRITKMQARLRQLEEQLFVAQTAAEERVARHEEEVATLREALANGALTRRPSAQSLKSPSMPRSPAFAPPRSPRSPMFPPKSPFLAPRRGSARSVGSRSATGSEKGDDDGSAAQIETLKGRVAELEKALADTEEEMQEIVGRMSEAQIEVLSLQEEREAAMRETRRLQRVLEQEQVKAFEERFRMLSSGALGA